MLQCLSVLWSMDEESRGLLRRLADHLRQQTGLALWNGPLLEPLLEIAPDLRGKVRAVITAAEGPAKDEVGGIKACSADALPEGVEMVSSALRAQWSG